MKYLAISGALAVTVAGLAYYMLFYVPSEESVSQTNKEQDGLEPGQSDSDEVAIRPLQGKATLESLRLFDKNLECSISYIPSEQAAAIEGTYFVSEGNTRGDFLTDSPDLSGQVLSSIIINGNMMYLWSKIEGEAYGVKIDTSKNTDTEAGINTPVPLEADVKYDCKLWENIDRTVFVPPGDILFRDLGQIMQSGMEYGTVYEE